MRFAEIIGSITSRLILSILFFLVVTPIGWLQRVFAKQPLEFGFKTGETTYWKPRSGRPVSEDYEKQF
jgi:hypothetical protein